MEKGRDIAAELAVVRGQFDQALGNLVLHHPGTLGAMYGEIIQKFADLLFDKLIDAAKTIAHLEADNKKLKEMVSGTAPLANIQNH